MSDAASARTAALRRTLIRRIADAAPDDALNLGLGQPDLPTPPPVVEAAVRSIADGRVHYTTTAGAPSLRDAIVRRYGVGSRDRSNALVTVGSQEAMVCALTVLTDPGDEVLVPDPGYPAYPTLVRLLGGRPTSYPLEASRGWRPDPEAFLERIGPRTRAVIFCTPGNPTGAILDDDFLDRVLPRLAERGVRWISDEVYDGLWYDRPFRSLSARPEREHGLVVSGVSKNWSMTGWRLGWVVGPQCWIDRAVAVHQHWVTCASAPSQAAAEAALGAEGAEWAERYRLRFLARRERAVATLAPAAGLEVRPPDGAFYLFARRRDGRDARPFCEALLRERKVVAIPGAAFGEAALDGFRISFAADEDVLAEGCRRIAEAAVAIGD